MSEGDQSWDDDMAMPESNEAPMPIVSLNFCAYCIKFYLKNLFSLNSQILFISATLVHA